MVYTVINSCLGLISMDAKAYAKNAGDIFVLPEAVVKIKQLIDDSTTSMHEIAEVIN